MPRPSFSAFDQVFESIDAALFAQSPPDAQMEPMLKAIEQQLRWRQQWILVAKVWALHDSQPWIDSIRLSWDAFRDSMDTNNGQEARVNQTLLTKLLDKAPQMPATEPCVKILNEVLATKNGPYDDRDFVVRIAMADAIEALPWALFGWSEDQQKRLVMKSLPSVARGLLDDASFAAWERASLLHQPHSQAQAPTVIQKPSLVCSSPSPATPQPKASTPSKPSTTATTNKRSKRL